MTIFNCGIYKITNTITGDYYIGSSSNIRKRTRQHQYALSMNKHANRYLQNARNKYGDEAFVYETILLCDPTHRLYFEQLFLDLLHPTYNIAINATAVNAGRSPSEETKRKLSEANTGKHPTEETRRKLSESHKGKQFTDEHKRKIGEAQKGKIISEEAKAKMKEAWKTRDPISTETREKMGKSLRLTCLTEEGKRRMSETAKLSNSAQKAKRKAEAQARSK